MSVMRAVHLTRVGLKSKAGILDQMVWLIEKVAKFITGMCNALPYGPHLFSGKYGVGILFPPSVFTGLAQFLLVFFCLEMKAIIC